MKGGGNFRHHQSRAATLFSSIPLVEEGTEAVIRSATVIRRSSEPNPPEQFQQWLDRVARPIEFATRDAFAHLPTVKNLNRFVSSQVMQALSDRVYPRAIEAALLQLRELFLEDQQRLPAEDQQRRLQEAMVILGVLRNAARDPARAWQEPEPIVVCEPAMNDTPSRAWWEQPIRFAKGVGPKRTVAAATVRDRDG